MPWPNQDGYSVREEAHFGTRVSRCYSERLGSIGALLAGVDPASEALVEGSRRVTHGELADQIRRVAANMAALGVAPGDRVAILLANRVEFVVTLLAAERVGAIAVPLNVREQHDELKRRQVQDLDPSYLIEETDPQTRGKKRIRVRKKNQTIDEDDSPEPPLPEDPYRGEISIVTCGLFL